jgi:hypothetical protein
MYGSGHTLRDTQDLGGLMGHFALIMAQREMECKLFSCVCVRARAFMCVCVCVSLLEITIN